MMIEYSCFWGKYPFNIFFYLLYVISVYRKYALIIGMLIQVTLNTTKLNLMKDPQFAIYGRTIRQNSP